MNFTITLSVQCENCDFKIIKLGQKGLKNEVIREKYMPQALNIVCFLLTFLCRVANLIIDMNQRTNGFDSEIKEIELSLSRVILTQLEKGVVTHEESQEIARFILSRIDEVKDANQLLAFLQSLYQKWNFFESTFGLYKLRINDETTTNQKIEEVNEKLSKINNN